MVKAMMASTTSTIVAASTAFLRSAIMCKVTRYRSPSARLPQVDWQA
jgi:hypothetical protein